MKNQNKDFFILKALMLELKQAGYNSSSTVGCSSSRAPRHSHHLLAEECQKRCNKYLLDTCCFALKQYLTCLFFSIL